MNITHLETMWTCHKGHMFFLPAGDKPTKCPDCDSEAKPMIQDTRFQGFATRRDGSVAVEDLTTGKQETFSTEREAYIATINRMTNLLRRAGELVRSAYHAQDYQKWCDNVNQWLRDAGVEK